MVVAVQAPAKNHCSSRDKKLAFVNQRYVSAISSISNFTKFTTPRIEQGGFTPQGKCATISEVEFVEELMQRSETSFNFPFPAIGVSVLIYFFPKKPV